MKLEQLKSLTEDELAILWYAVNKTNPPVLAGVELEPSVFPSISHHSLIARVANLEIQIKPEHKAIYDSLREKLTQI